MTTVPYYASPPPPKLPFQDKRTGLRVMGVIQVVIGALAGCLALTMPLAVLVPRLAGGPPAQDLRDMVGGAIMYAAAAGFFIGTGIGSLRLRRWVRPLMLITAWPWLISGVMILAYWAVALPSLEQMAAATNPNAPPGPASATALVGWLVGVLVFVSNIALPGAFVWFYRQGDVRATLNYFDPRPGWTDACPTPVLGLSVWLALTTLLCLDSLLYGVFPAFGTVLTGMPADIVLVTLTVVLAFLARATYRLRADGWWGTVLLLVLWTTTWAWTIARVGAVEMYRKSGYLPEQIERMEQINAAQGVGPVIGLTVLSSLAAFGYLLHVRRYFNVPTAARAGAARAEAEPGRPRIGVEEHAPSSQSTWATE